MFPDEHCHPSDDVDLRIVKSMLRPKVCSIIVQGCVWIVEAHELEPERVSRGWRLLSTIVMLGDIDAQVINMNAYSSAVEVLAVTEKVLKLDDVCDSRASVLSAKSRPRYSTKPKSS
jgi:hypothetical protein